MQRRFACALWIVCLLLLAGAVTAQETDDAEKEALARELLEVTGAGEMGIQVMQQIFDMFKSTNPEVPAEFWDGVMDEVDAEALVELTLPIYLKHLTREELAASIEFYRTPAGRSLLQKMPIIMQESMTAGQRWGMELGQSVAERLEAWKASKPDDA